MPKISVIFSDTNGLSPLVDRLRKELPECVIEDMALGPETAPRIGDVLPDILVLSLKGLEPEGVSFMKAVHADPETMEIPLVLCTSRPLNREERAAAFDAHAAAVLTGGPSALEDVGDQVRALLRFRASLEGLRQERNALGRRLEEIDRSLTEKSKKLAKRLKELDCFYGISLLREKPRVTLEEIFQGVVDLVADACQSPETTCARILLGYQEFKTANFRDTRWKLSCDIRAQDEWAGRLELCYLEKPDGDEFPFLKEEQTLITAIAERLGRITERLHADASLQLESENLINILKSMEDWVYKINDDYQVEYANPALQREYGPPEGKKCYDYFHGLDAPCADCKSAVVFKGETLRREFFFPKTKKTYDALETPMINPDGSVSKLSIFRDLTAISQAQKTLGEREQLYRSVTESIADGAVMVQDGKILFANHAFVMMFGYKDLEELSGKDVVQLFDKDFRGLFSKVFDPGEKDTTLENLVRGVCVTKDFRKFWVSTNRRIIRLKAKPAILATMRDITEDMLQQESVQEVAEHLRKENIKLRSSIHERYRFGDIVGKSLPMQEVYEFILKAAESNANVIILGESGTGKELVARAIHRLSARAKKAFVPVNCGAIPETLVESEFFGHRKGAFTGAHIDKTGYLETASGGTLFLDEIGELVLNIQVKLLRALEIGDYTPVGDTRVRRSDLRIISATNRDLQRLVGQGRIREDFYYRISVIPIKLPPLREKKDDIPLLVEHFLRMYGKESQVRTIPGKISEILYNYDWPGNVRELQSVVQRYLAVGNFDFLSADGTLDKMEGGQLLDVGEKVLDLREAKESFERRIILAALNKCRWHRGKAAAALNIDPKTLYKKMKKVGLS